MRSCLALLAFGASSLFGQSRVDLLQRVASHYENADSFDVRGTASPLIPGSSWQVSYDFETEAAQPWFVPLNTGGPSMQEISFGRQATQRRVRADDRVTRADTALRLRTLLAKQLLVLYHPQLVIRTRICLPHRAVHGNCEPPGPDGEPRDC